MAGVDPSRELAHGQARECARTAPTRRRRARCAGCHAGANLCEPFDHLHETIAGQPLPRSCCDPRSRLAYSTAAAFGRGPGAVAQLGERLNGIQEVDGSIPFSSTKGFREVRPEDPHQESGRCAKSGREVGELLAQHCLHAKVWRLHRAPRADGVHGVDAPPLPLNSSSSILAVASSCIPG